MRFLVAGVEVLGARVFGEFSFRVFFSSFQESGDSFFGLLEHPKNLQSGS
jgi:hypothetical protein